MAHEFHAVHLRHLQIAEYQLNRFGAGFQRHQGVFSVLVGDNLRKTQICQLLFKQLEQKGVVINE